MKGNLVFVCAMLVLIGCSGSKSGRSAASDPYVRANELGLYTDLTYLSQRSVPEGTDAAPLYDKLGQNYSWQMTPAFYDYLNGEAGRDAAEQILEVTDFSVIEEITTRPNFVLNRDWTKPIEWILPEISQSKSMSRLLCTRALYRVQDGRIDDAAQDLRRVATLQEHMRQYGMALSQLTRSSNLTILARAAQQIAVELSDRPGELQLILDELSAIAEPENLDTIRHEIALVRGSIGQLRRGDLSLEEFSASPLGPTPAPPNPFDVARIDKYGDEIERYVTSLYVRCAEVWQDRDQLASVYQAIEDELEPTASDGYKTVLTKTIAMMLGPMDGLQAYEDRQRAHLRTMRIGVAATILRAGDGDWPTLDEAAKYAGTSVQDPFGDRLRYKAEGPKLLVYSVGPDGTDEGGARTREEREDPYDLAVFEVTAR
ncbi:MAG: hypothetical protein IH945_06185 [Armatimonadetes bacterium]|nr:hypothetical protein [Armatimonadota bacterium]